MGYPGGGRGSALISRAVAARKPAEVSRALFAAAPDRPVTARGVVLAVAAVVAAVGVGLLRQPGAGALNTIWAEDGTIFLSQAVDKGPLAALATSYAGYFHAVPRLAGAISAAVPASAAAATLALSAALCTALLALLVYVASAGHLSSRPARIIVSAGLVVVPLGQDEVLNSIANFHWYGLYALFWVLLWSPRGRAGQVVAVVTTLLVATSDILVVAFVPLALFRALRRGDDGGRDGVGITLAGALAAGLLVQFAGLASGSSSRPLSPDPVLAVSGYLLRAVPGPLVGQRWLGSDMGPRWVLLAGLAWLVVIAVVLVALRGLTRPAWALASVAGLYSAALYLLPVVLSGLAATRYAVAPGLLVVVTLVALLQPGGTAGRRPLYLLAALLAIVAAVNLRIDNPRAHGPQWGEELRQARAACATPGQQARIVIAPRVDPPWTVTVPCHDLD